MPGMRLPLVLALACLAALAATQATDYAAATSLAIEWGLENSSWPTNPPCTATGPCRTWPGVTWVGDRITEIVITAATIPDSNIITATWPNSLWNLTELTTLTIADKILPCPPFNPAASIRSLVNLRELRIRNRRNAQPANCSLFDEFSALVNLTVLQLSEFGFSDNWPTTLGGLTQLRQVYLDGNDWTPQNFMDLSASAATLITLKISLSVNPSSPNQISWPVSAASWLPQMSALTELTAERVFSGQFSCPPGSWPNLRILDLDNNDFGGSPLPVCMSPSCADLATYSFSGANMTVPFPTQLSACTTLATLNIAGADMKGTTVPSLFGTLTSLTTVVMENLKNHGGGLPTEIGNLKSLDTLRLRGSGFSGSLPTEIGSLPLLTSFDAPANGFTGPLPEEWAFATALDNIVLWGNPIGGDTPGWLVHMALGASAQVDIGNNSNPIVRLTNCSYEPKVQVSPTSPRANQVVFTVNYYPIQLCNPCQLPRPLPGTVCYKKQWVIPGSGATINGTVTIGNTPIVILGDYTLPPTGVVQVTVTTSSGPLVVLGTATVDGELRITIPTGTVPPDSVAIVNATAIAGNFTDIVVTQGPDSCYAATEWRTGTTLSVLFNAPSDGCAPASKKSNTKRTAILAGAIGGAFVLVVVLTVVLVFMHRRRAGRWLWDAWSSEDNTITI